MTGAAAARSGRRIRRVTFAVLVWGGFAWFMFCPVKPAALLSAGNVQGRINQVGPSRVIGEMFDTPAWDALVGHVAKGRPDWLELVPRLQPALDGDAAEEMRDHLGLALPLNPAGVLAVTDPRNGAATGVESVCSVAFGNNLDQPPPRDFVQRSIRSVAGVRDPKLSAARDRCLAVLRRGVCTVCTSPSA